MSDEVTGGLPRLLTRREVLERLQLSLCAAMDLAEIKERHAISRELRQVAAELEGLPGTEASAPADQLAAARERRRQEAAEAARAASQGG